MTEKEYHTETDDGMKKFTSDGKVKMLSTEADVNQKLSSIIGEKFIEYRKKFEAASNFQLETEFPLYIQIELHQICNLKCPMCSIGHPDENQKYVSDDKMSWETYKKVILECEKYGCPSMNPQGINEPLLTPDFEKYIKFASINNISNNSKKFQNDCEYMYKTKTYERIKIFQNQDIDNISYINGIFVEPIINIINKIDWNKIISTAIPANFHGDLQPENIIVSKDNTVFLIDWRESFGTDLNIGDLYYDLSKLYHGLLINGTIVKEKKFSVNIENNQAKISYLSKDNLIEFNKKLELFCQNHQIEYNHVKLLGILHYVNIAEFYMKTEPEYSKFIFLLGKLLMSEYLNKLEK